MPKQDRILARDGHRQVYVVTGARIVVERELKSSGFLWFNITDSYSTRVNGVLLGTYPSPSDAAEAAARFVTKYITGRPIIVELST